MTDHAALADVIYEFSDGEIADPRLAAAIVAAVNEGRIPPIVPDVGAWLTSIPAAELASLRALKAKVDECASDGRYAVVVHDRPRPIAYAATLLAWLREPTE